jgi:DNA polymerase I
MSNPVFAIFLSNPFEIKPIILYKDVRPTVTQEVSALTRYDKVYAFDVECAIESFRNNNIIKFPEIVDIRTALKLLNGKPKSAFREGGEPWSLNRILGNKVQQSSLKLIDSFQRLRITSQEFVQQNMSSLTDIMDGFERAWGDILNLLVERAENERFFKVEHPIFNIFLQTTLDGVLVPQHKLLTKLEELNRAKYTHLKTLEFRYNFISQRVKSAMTWKNIEGYSTQTYLSDDFDTDFWRTAEDFSDYCQFLDVLVSYRKSSVDYDALLRYVVDGYQRIYPRFDIMGTVTGRILVVSPGVQYLKKTSRSIFSPDDNSVFLYADFDQFEPGIMASLSQDQGLIDIYNHGDVYTQLSQVIFATPVRRKVAKVLFLSYMYGMGRNKLLALIRQLAGEQAQEEAESFFSKFSRLEDWKKKLCENAKETGFAESLIGNRRYTQQKGSLLPSEERWIPSQVVQGTASLIFKLSIIRLKQEAAFVQFLIPMHDAILVQVPRDQAALTQQFIEVIFCDTFRQLCPRIIPRISFESFHGG